MNVGDVFTKMWMYFMSLDCTTKMVKKANFMLCVYQKLREYAC